MEAGKRDSFRLLSECPLPTEVGDCMLRIYGDGTCSPWPVCVFGEVHGKNAVTVRLHDACMTSELFGSVKCDCALQLRLAQRQLAASSGVLVYSPQEGRGIGLAAKVAAYNLQARDGLDTVDANRALGLPDEARNYDVVPCILRDLGVASIRLLTNNPFKVDSLRALGVEVDGNEECQVCDDELSDVCRFYLSTKAKRMNHMLSAPAHAAPQPTGQPSAQQPAVEPLSPLDTTGPAAPPPQHTPPAPPPPQQTPPTQGWLRSVGVAVGLLSI